MRKVDIIHLFIYFMIWIILSNWYINYILIRILSVILFTFFLFSISMIISSDKIKKENKKLKKLIKNKKS